MKIEQGIVSGSIVSLSWIDKALPLKATLDITLVLVDPDTNSKATRITRRPFLRFVLAMERTLDIVIPYDLITKKQLKLEQEQGSALMERKIEIYEKDHKTLSTETIETTNLNGSMLIATRKEIQSLVRLYITAYEGKTNNMLVRKSIFPTVIMRDYQEDTSALLPPPHSEKPEQVIFNEHSVDGLENEESDFTYS
ncbi:hypothetical protein BGZ49_000792 [Haplosporangium sp. Z 27]|nr:hypothetical protein BGZ49_000792 [Haplosporangium sp. Z 27]